MIYDTEFKSFVDDIVSCGRKFWLEVPPISSAINSKSGGLLELLLRSGRIQVERVIHGPNEIVPLHRHPHVDSCEFTLSGIGELWLRKRIFVLDANTTPWKPMFVSRRCFHGGKAYDKGGSFLSVQFWHSPIRSVKDDWEDAV